MQCPPTHFSIDAAPSVLDLSIQIATEMPIPEHDAELVTRFAEALERWKPKVREDLPAEIAAHLLFQGLRAVMVVGRARWPPSRTPTSRHRCAQIGNVGISAHEAPALVTDNIVDNSYFHDIGVEYPGAYGVWNANTQNTTVTHNVFAHLPRGGFASWSSGSWRSCAPSTFGAKT